ncbi:MAG: hypothetical protein U9N34_02615, partial [Candidatus Cloacimonadota bacterium]|nr:hypothetical protein [Candidatus Cloacimonadota bacterium]
MKNIITLLFIVLTTILSSEVVWEEDLPIRQGANIKWNRTIANLGDDVVCVWTDTHQGSRDVYAQKFDSQGNMLWNNGDPIVIDDKVGGQEFPVIIETSDNCVIVAWVDYFYESGETDIYVQKVDSDGQLLWQEGGIPVCTAEDMQNELAIVTNNIGGAIIIWHDYRNTGGVDIYGASLDADGNNIWTENGNPIANEIGSQTGHTFWEDGNGGAVLAYVDNYNNDENIKSKGIAADGSISWTTMICDYDDEGTSIIQSRVKSAKDNEGGFIFVWQDKRNVNTDLYGQRVNIDGEIQWAENGIQITTFEAEDVNPRLCTSSDNGAFIAWENGAATSSDLYITKISNDGTNVWGNVVISEEVNAQNNPRVSTGADGGVYVVWGDHRNEDLDIFAQHYDSNGNELWLSGGRAICDLPLPQVDPEININNENVYISWNDSRNGSVGLYYQLYDFAGNQLLEDNGEQIFLGLSGNAEELKIVETNEGKYFIWKDGRNNYLGKQIFVQKIDGDGNIYFDENGVELAEKIGDYTQ